ncbi:HEPN domain-containing protein [Brevundimonas phoenicis]|uniref:HEPN domain-containing protein n=1 Tax=Brevundimonas sp. 2P05AC TaxID=3132271 RepID=UPI0039A41EC0
MQRADLDTQLQRIDELIAEITKFVPADDISAGTFRADLAGLLVVSIAATYESCVKNVLVSYAHKQHVVFGNYTTARYARLSSKVSIRDLHSYANTFDSTVGRKFKSKLLSRKTAINAKLGKDIEKSYEQLLDWRHAFAHAGSRNTTIEEAASTHKLAKRVIYCFGEAFT